jgi:hypothetical protein
MGPHLSDEDSNDQSMRCRSVRGSGLIGRMGPRKSHSTIAVEMTDHGKVMHEMVLGTSAELYQHAERKKTLP